MKRRMLTVIGSVAGLFLVLALTTAFSRTSLDPYMSWYSDVYVECQIEGEWTDWEADGEASTAYFGGSASEVNFISVQLDYTVESGGESGWDELYQGYADDDGEAETDVYASDYHGGWEDATLGWIAASWSSDHVVDAVTYFDESINSSTGSIGCGTGGN